MAQLIYKYGKKTTYLSLTNRSDTTLYFCTDTHELYKGDDLYTDGIRTVNTYSALPPFNIAADGKLYYCKDTGSGYLLNETRDGWIQVIFGLDHETLDVNAQGAMYVKAIPMDVVTGLNEKFTEIENKIDSSMGSNSVKIVETFSDLPLIGNTERLYSTRNPARTYIWNAESAAYELVSETTKEEINVQIDEAITSANTYTDIKIAEITKASSLEIVEF